MSDEEAARAESARLAREHDPAPLPIDVLVELERILTHAGRRSRPARASAVWAARTA